MLDKPQPAPAILSQESVHTMLSITHHTRKRPSTDPRTTHGPQSPGLVGLCMPSLQPLCGIGRVHLIAENFYRLPFTPPLFGRLIGPSLATSSAGIWGPAVDHRRPLAVFSRVRLPFERRHGGALGRAPSERPVGS
jgi:hypothetical protein